MKKMVLVTTSLVVPVPWNLCTRSLGYQQGSYLRTWSQQRLRGSAPTWLWWWSCTTFEMRYDLGIWFLPRPSLWSSHHSCGQQRIVGQGSWIPPWSLQTLTPGKRKLDEMMVMRKVLLRKVLPGSRRKCQWQWRQQKVQFPGRGYHPEVLRRHLPRMLSLTMMLWSNFQHFERNIKWRWRQWWDLDAVGKEAEDGAKPEK